MTTLTNEERSKAYSTIITSALDIVPTLSQLIETENIDGLRDIYDDMPMVDIDVFQDGTLRDAIYIWVARQQDDTNIKALVSIMTKSLKDIDPYGNKKALTVLSMISTMTFMKGHLEPSFEMTSYALSNCPDINEAPETLGTIAKSLVLASSDMSGARKVAHDFEKSCLSLDTDEFWKLNF